MTYLTTTYCCSLVRFILRPEDGGDTFLETSADFTKLYGTESKLRSLLWQPKIQCSYPLWEMQTKLKFTTKHSLSELSQQFSSSNVTISLSLHVLLDCYKFVHFSPESSRMQVSNMELNCWLVYERKGSSCYFILRDRGPTLYGCNCSKNCTKKKTSFRRERERES